MTVLRSGSASDTGLVRSSNQDLALASSTLFAVADGMGGHAGGEVASRVAIDELVRAFGAQPSGPGLVEAISAANHAVWTQSRQNSELRGMGTTLTAAALVDEGGRDVLMLVNVGDSRSYRFHQGELTQITDDHSVAEEMFRSGEISAAEAAVHPHRHILTRALGVAPSVVPDIWRLVPTTGDRYLLCSDGLTNEVGDAHIGEILGSVADPQQTADALVNAARRNGGNDNITVVVLDVAIGDDSGGGQVVAAAVAMSGVGSGGQPAGAALGAGPGALPDVAGASVPAAAGVDGLQVAQFSRADLGAPVPVAPPEPPRRGIGRRARRQRSAHPRSRRLLTFRTAVFAVLTVAVLFAAYAAVRWYDTSSYYVGVKADHLVIYQGRVGGFLWYRPVEVEATGVKTTDVPATYLPAVRAGVQESSLADARKYVRNLVATEQSTHPTTTAPQQPPAATPPPTSTTLVAPGGSV